MNVPGVLLIRSLWIVESKVGQCCLHRMVLAVLRNDIISYAEPVENRQDKSMHKYHYIEVLRVQHRLHDKPTCNFEV